MANIVIKDLDESKELDKKAMAAILGGSRSTSLSSGAYAYQHHMFRSTHHPILKAVRKGRLK